MLHAIVHAADVQDRDGGILLMSTLFGIYPFLVKLFADSAYSGRIFDSALSWVLPQLKIEIVKRTDAADGFVVLPKRWIVERSIAGSIAVVVSSKIGKISTETLSRFFASPPSALCCESSAIRSKLSDSFSGLDQFFDNCRPSRDAW